MGELKSINETLNELVELGEFQQKAENQYAKECDDYWTALPYHEKLMAFYSVCKRIHKGDMIDEGSYRHVLYQIFGFDMDAYSIGMECRYMDIHNGICNQRTTDAAIAEVLRLQDIEEKYNKLTHQLEDDLK